jgi:hypothetical protein
MAPTPTILTLPSIVGRWELQREPIATAAVVHETLRTLAHQIAQRQVQVTVGPLPVVHADRLALAPIFGHLLANAVADLEPGRPGEITITATQQPGVTVFAVQDTRNLSRGSWWQMPPLDTRMEQTARITRLLERLRTCARARDESMAAVARDDPLTHTLRSEPDHLSPFSTPHRDNLSLCSSLPARGRGVVAPDLSLQKLASLLHVWSTMRDGQRWQQGRACPGESTRESMVDRPVEPP